MYLIQSNLILYLADSAELALTRRFPVRLRPIDVEFMKRLGKIVSIVPVIAKADTLTMDERLEFKQRVSGDLDIKPILMHFYSFIQHLFKRLKANITLA